jgi:hypothetical protein
MLDLGYRPPRDVTRDVECISVGLRVRLRLRLRKHYPTRTLFQSNVLICTRIKFKYGSELDLLVNGSVLIFSNYA